MNLNNFKIKFIFIVKFFFLTRGGVFRKAYLFQIAGIYIGALIISLTFSIMTGLEQEIFNKIKDFNYKYMIKKNSTELNSYGFANNKGKKSLVRCELDNYDFLINVISYTEFDTFVNDKIKNHLFDDDVIYNDSSIIIGESLSKKYNISIGDTILLSDIVNINVVTGNYISEKFIVANIFKFKFLNFDYENVFINENDNSFLKAEDYNIYFDKDYRNNIDSNQYEIDEVIESGNKYSSLISSIQFEKKLYVLLGILTIIISSVMMFNNTLMVLLEKRRQFSLLNNIGVGLNKMLFAILLLNIILSLCLAVFGILTTFFIEKLNYQFNIIDYFFMYSPFDSIPMNLSSNQCITTLLLIIILTAISTILSIYNIKDRLEEG
jgi:ABC-type lipoprotein release transport system permease subunit